jgi:hypothetical protein
LLPALNRPLRRTPRQPRKEQAVMAKAKLQQIDLNSGEDATQPPFPGGWVLAVFDALSSFAPALAAKRQFQLPISKRTQERIKAANVVKQGSYNEVEGKLVELITALFPTVSIVNGFAKKYVDEYFRLWKQAAAIAPSWLKCLGFRPGESQVVGRALFRDLVLRLCYLESCERRLSGITFGEEELAFLRHDCPTQVYQALISERARLRKLSQEKLAEGLAVTEKSLLRLKRGESLPSIKLLLDLKQPGAGPRLLAGVGFVDRLLRTLGLHKSVLRNEFLAVASVFFRDHPMALEFFNGSIVHLTASGAIRHEKRGFEGYVAFGDYLLLHPGFKELYPEMPDALWRAHLYTLQSARVVDLAQAYYQFSIKVSDSPLEDFLREAEHESGGCPYRWMAKLGLHKGDLSLPPTNTP